MSFWDRLLEGLREVGTAIGDFVPKLIGALIILIVGWWIARIIKSIVQRLLSRPAVGRVLDRAGIGPMLRDAGYSGEALIANIIYAIALVIVFLLAFQALQVEAIVELLQALIAYLPLVVVAVIILVLTAAFGNFLGDLVAPWATQRNVPWVTLVARYAVIIFGVITALDVLGVGEVTTRIYEFTLGALAVAFAVSFGVGGIDTAKKWWAKYLSPSD